MKYYNSSSLRPATTERKHGKKLILERRTAMISARSTLAGQNKKKNLSCSPHIHSELELVCYLDGKTLGFVDNKVCEFEAGDVFLTFPNQIHYFRTDEPDQYLIFIINADYVPELAEIFKSNIPLSPLVKGMAKDEHIKKLFFDLYDTMLVKNYDDYTEIRRHALILLIFSEILSRMTLERIDENAPTRASGSLGAIVSYCSRHYTESLSLAHLEERLHLNKYYISHIFSEKLGLSFNDYINHLRITEACRYLSGTDCSVTEISELVGFNTLRTFNRAFLRHMGLSPTDYRRAERISSRAFLTDTPKGKKP